jgi:membrane protease YdiL (CAAX protease family)
LIRSLIFILCAIAALALLIATIGAVFAMITGRGADHFDRLDFLLLPAFFKAMATACFCGLPAFISVLMFELIVLCDEPFFRGIITTRFFQWLFRRI